VKHAARRLRRRLQAAAALWRTVPLTSLLAATRGECPICERATVFLKASEWLRDHYYCARCLSLPRFRAVIRVLGERFPDWRGLAIHESSPAGPASAKLARECTRYTATQFFPDVEPGGTKAGQRCEDLERQTFGDAAFDLVVTQDVFEHVLDPGRAFAEVARTLRPGGSHVFTVPWYYWKPTVVRARRLGGTVVHDLPPEYHANPIDRGGSLVVTEWGADLLEFIERSSGLQTTVEHVFDPRQGICGEFREVFVSRKP
jgi:hypothetical protein